MSAEVTVLGLGEMGRALAARLLDQGHAVTVWNRSAGKADSLIAAGARKATTLHDAVPAGPLVVVCVRDYTSARVSLESESEALAGRTLVNLTTGTPEEARAMATWAAEHEVAYLDGGIMAIPAMIGTPEAILLYSGSPEAYADHRDALDGLGSARYLGDDAGMAALQDLALLAAMYAMFAGQYQALAMVASAGVKAGDFAEALGSWQQAMLGSLPMAAQMIDADDYATDVQDLEFTRTAIETINRASADAGVGDGVLAPIATMIERQIATGHGQEHFTRMIESIRTH